MACKQSIPRYPGCSTQQLMLCTCRASALIRCAFLHLRHKLLSSTSQGCALPAVQAVVVRILPATTSSSQDSILLVSNELGWAVQECGMRLEHWSNTFLQVLLQVLQ